MDPAVADDEDAAVTIVVVVAARGLRPHPPLQGDGLPLADQGREVEAMAAGLEQAAADLREEVVDDPVAADPGPAKGPSPWIVQVASSSKLSLISSTSPASSASR